MIFGIYIKSSPKKKWYLMSIATNAEEIAEEIEKLKEQALKEGNDQIQIGAHATESIFFIPEILEEIKDQKLIFN